MLESKREILPLTGLRGIAALLVVLAHYIGWYAPYQSRTEPQWFRAFFETDQLGMTLFFTLSGFVIAYNYLDMDWGGAALRSLGRFMVLRLSRLYPALLVFLLLVIVWRRPYDANAAIPDPAGTALSWFLLHLASVETWLPFKTNGMLPVNGVYFVSWSIATEIGMYLMFAAGLIAWRKWPRHRRIMAWLLALYVVAMMTLMLSDAAARWLFARLGTPMEALDESEWQSWLFNLSPYGRFLNFLTGAGAAYVVMRRPAAFQNPAPWRLAAALSTGVLVLYYLLGTAGWQMRHVGIVLVLMGLLFAVIMANGMDRQSALNRVLAAPPLLTLGHISYSLYLFHFLQAQPRLQGSAPFSASHLPALALNLALGLGLITVVAYGSYHLIERPAQAWLRRTFLRSPASSTSLAQPADLRSITPRC
jgi:peptidoglycan/LPS O-acetylase OafA/YrhL